MIQEINMLSAPTALNFDGVPGPDGVSLRLYAANPRQPKSLPISRGTLEILIFDGVVKPDDLEAARPLHVWSYPADKLARYGQRTSIGVSYVLTPRWGQNKPVQNRATVLARYLAPEGRKVYSAPAVVFVTKN